MLTQGIVDFLSFLSHIKRGKDNKILLEITKFWSPFEKVFNQVFPKSFLTRYYWFQIHEIFLIFSKAVPSALLMSLVWELWPFQQFCDLFGTFVTFLWPFQQFYDLFVTFMTFLWPVQHFCDLFMNDMSFTIVNNTI